VVKARFDELVWRDDVVSIDGVRFRLYERFDSPPALDDGTYWLFKGPELVSEYIDVLRKHPDLDVRNLFELGIWESGSVAFFAKCFLPDKHVAIDLAPHREPTWFRRFLKQENIESRVRTYWQTDQADDARLQSLVRREMDGPLDLVIDDASHWLEPTAASVVTLFPLLRPGGLFIVEDWGWHLVPEVRAAFPKEEPGLVPLIDSIIALMRDEPTLIRSFDLRDHLFAFERGPMPEADARARLQTRLSPRFTESPPLLTRMVKGSPAWSMARRIVRSRQSRT